MTKLGHGKPHLTHPRPVRGAHDHRDTLAPAAEFTPLERAITGSSTVSDGMQPIRAKNVRGYYEMLCEHPFDSTIKRMSTAWIYHPHQDEDQSEGHLIVFMKGATERLLDRCSFIGIAKSANDKSTFLPESVKRDVLSHMDELAGEGLRVLSLCGRVFPAEEADRIKVLSRDELEKDLGFLGLVGI